MTKLILSIAIMVSGLTAHAISERTVFGSAGAGGIELYFWICDAKKLALNAAKMKVYEQCKYGKIVDTESDVSCHGLPSNGGVDHCHCEASYSAIFEHQFNFIEPYFEFCIFLFDFLSLDFKLCNLLIFSDGL